MQRTQTQEELGVRSIRSTGPSGRGKPEGVSAPRQAASSAGRAAIGIAIGVLVAFSPGTIAATGPDFPATAAEMPDTPAAPSGAEPSQGPAALTGPAIDAPADGSFIGTGSTAVSGTKDPGAGIQLSVGSSSEPACIIPADELTSWSCTVQLPDGPGVALRAAESDVEQSASAQVTVRALGPPSVEAGAASNGGLRGTAAPGASVTALADNGSTCTFTADASGSWFCVLSEPLPTGTYSVTATAHTDYSGDASSAASAPVSVSVDRDPPAPPTVTSPAAGTPMPLAPATYTGTGEEGAMVTVFADATSVCSAVVSGGRWSCTGGGVPAGGHRVLAIQQDAAGNTSQASVVHALDYGQHASTASPTPLPKKRQRQASPTPEATLPSELGGPPSPTPAADAIGPFSDGTGSGGPWSRATPFTAPSSATGHGDPPQWWLAILLALATLLLIAAPARLLATVIGPPLRSAIASRRARITGRNHPAADFDAAPELRPPGAPVTAALSLVLAAGFAVFSYPVASEPAYFRLWLAALLALGSLNAATVGAQALVARLARLGPVRVEPRPRWIVSIGAIALLSRMLALHPALLFGLVIDATLSGRPSAEALGRLAHTRVCAAALLGTGAWLLSGALGEASGAAGSFFVEFANVTAIAGLGSASLAILPAGPLGGLAVFRWSRTVWAVSALSSFTLLFGLIGPASTTGDPGAATAALGIGALAFAATAAAAWAWTRHLRPSFESPN